MFKKFAIVAIPAFAILVGGVGAAQAAGKCDASIKEVQAKWDKMYPMGMDRPGGSGYQSVTDSFRIAKERCAKGDQEAEHYLNIVRAHLGMPEVATGHKPNPPNTETLHSDGPSAHHDAPTSPAMGSKAGPAGQDIKPEGASAPVLGK